MNEVMEAICQEVFDLNSLKFDLDFIRQKSRDQEHIYLRKICAHVLRNNGHTFESIGKFLNIDHASVMHLLKKVNWGYNLPPKLPKPNSKMKVASMIRHYESEIKRLRELLNK